MRLSKGGYLIFFSALFILIVWSIQACNNNNVKSSKQEPGVDTAMRSSSESSANVNTGFKKDTSFRHFWESFKSAIKEKNEAKLELMTYFPLGGGRACFIDQLHAQADYNNDSLGILQPEFKQVFDLIFDDEASALSNVPVDSVVRFNEMYPDTHLHVLERMKDKESDMYAYMLEYAIGNRGGDKVFVFARIQGEYKLAWVICDGVIIR
jgi:predicted Ser/Thr protein kinase